MRDFPNPAQQSCRYCRKFDHVIEDFPTLIAKMQEKNMETPTQNLQMVRAETREEDPSMNVVTRSGVATNEDKGKKLTTDVWIYKAPKKKKDFIYNAQRRLFLKHIKNLRQVPHQHQVDQ